MKPKIALCLSGALRNFKDTFYSFEEMLLQKHDVDVFFYGPENKEGLDQNKKDLEKLFKPKKYIINNPSFYGNGTFPFPCIHTPPTPYYSFYNIFKSNELKKQYETENNFKYDLVIRSRADYFWFRPVTGDRDVLS